MDGGKDSDFRSYLTRDAVSLALLAGLAVLFFLGVTVLSRLYHAQQESLGSRWFNRGVVDLKAQRFDRAVIEFRAALVYARDDYAYQLNLAEALVGMKRTAEAYAYLVNLWEREPEDGLVNLELARIAAQRGQTRQAQRYYHNAIYATWSDNTTGNPSIDNTSDAAVNDATSRQRSDERIDEEARRRDTRLELIEFLLKINARTQAQSELIALEENVGDDATEQEHVGELFIRAQDYEHALAAYRASLKSSRRIPAALAGAGLAAFELGRYDQAREYLQGAVNANSSDAQSASRLKTAELVLRMDPFRAGISASEREQTVMAAFAAAGDRLKSCSTGTSHASAETDLAANWATMQPEVTAQGLRRNPDMTQKAMDLVFNIERQTGAGCGTPGETDAALLLIAKLHEGN